MVVLLLDYNGPGRHYHLRVAQHDGLGALSSSRAVARRGRWRPRLRPTGLPWRSRTGT